MTRADSSRTLVWLLGQVGLPILLVIYLLDMIPWLPSPIDRIQRGLEAHQATMISHDQGTQRTLRLICRGIWRDSPPMQVECDR